MYVCGCQCIQLGIEEVFDGFEGDDSCVYQDKLWKIDKGQGDEDCDCQWQGKLLFRKLCKLVCNWVLVYIKQYFFGYKYYVQGCKQCQ